MKQLQSFILSALYRLIGPTLRIDTTALTSINTIKKKNLTPALFAVWHDETFVCFYHYRNRQVGFLREASLNGEILASVAKSLGYVDFAVTDNANDRQTIKATIQFIKYLQDGHDGVFAIDGPRGPYHKAKPGILYIAEKAKVTVIALKVKYSHAMRFWWRWDKYLIPLPFSRCTITVTEIQKARAATGDPAAALEQHLN